MSDCEGCPPEDLGIIMAKKKQPEEETAVKQAAPSVIDHLAEAVKALDELYKDNEENQIYRATRSKIVATLKYTKARI